jgi:hypothetical protein
MGMTPDGFYLSFVLGNYSDFQDQPDCLRCGFNAAVAASHMADHIWWYSKRHDPARISCFPERTDYLEYVNQRTNGFFRDIRGIANVYKHLYDDKDLRATIGSGGDIEAVTRKTGTIREVAYGDGEGTDRVTVVYRRKTGKRFELLPVLTKIVDFWSKEIDPIDDETPTAGETDKAPE